MTTKQNNLGSLEGFEGWEDFSSDQDFFSEDIEGTPEEDEKEDNEDSGIPKEEKKSEEEPDEDKEESLFDEDPVNVESESSENDDEENKEDISDSITAISVLKNKGIIDFELEEGEELTDEVANDLIEDAFSDAVESKVEDLLKDLPDPVKQLNKFVIEGGDFTSFLNKLTKTNIEGISLDINLEEESNQELVIRKMLEKEGIDHEEAEIQIEFLRDSGKMKAFAEKKFERWKKDKEEATKKLTESQKEARIAQEKQDKENKKVFSEFISSEEDFGGIVLNKKDKKDMPSYLTDKNVKLKSGGFVTQFQVDLFSKALSNRITMVQLGALIKNMNKDGTLDFSSLIRQGETKATKELKRDLRRSKNTQPNKSKGFSRKQDKRLADYFN